MDLMLNSHDDLTNDIVESGVVTLHDLFRCVRNYRYERIDSDRLTDVWYHRKGTCSSKHAFVKYVAELNDIEIQLTLVLFKMNATNTPKLKSILEENDLEYIPEAHCVLKVNGEYEDLTFNTSTIKNIENDILDKKEVSLGFILNNKTDFHKDYLETFIANNSEFTKKSFDEIWTIREACIQILGEQ